MPDIFKRKEVKYLLTSAQREAVEKGIESYMIPDEHGESCVRNVYFDTQTGLLIRRSLEKPVYKEKLRMRSYIKVPSEGKCFLELKKKYKGIVYKRRIEVNEREFLEYLKGNRDFPENGQIANEIDYFCKFYKDIAPRVFLSYDRTAYYAKDDRNLRMTFDRNICWRTEKLSLSESPGGDQLLPEGCSLMEIKAADAMPLWLVQLLTENDIKKRSFSKYGTAYSNMLKMKGTYRYA